MSGMRFKVADRSQTVEPIAWRPLGVLRQEPIASKSRNEGEPVAQQSENDLFKLQLSELERRHQAQLAGARQEAFQQGVQQVRAEMADELRAGADRVGHALADLAVTKRKLRNESEMELIQLSLAIAKRILHRELMSDPEALHGLVHAALQKLQNREISRVRVFPGGADAIRAALERVGAAPAITVFPDQSLKSGDLIFETSFGDLDASIETQLQEIQRGFADRLAIR